MLKKLGGSLSIIILVLLYIAVNHSFSRLSSDEANLGTVIFIILVIFTTIFMNYKNNTKKNGSVFKKKNKPKNTKVPDNSSYILPEITEIDSEFNKDKFLEWSEEVFVIVKNALAERDCEKIYQIEEENLYKQHEIQIREYINKGWINVIEKINIINVTLYRYDRDNENEYLTVFVMAEMIDYIRDENTRSIIRGSNNQDCLQKYLLTFTRKKFNNCGWLLFDMECIRDYINIKAGGVFIDEDD